MNELQAFIKEKNISASDAQKIISIYLKLVLDEKESYCGVCGKKLNKDEKKIAQFRNPRNFVVTCSEHAQFAHL